MVGTDKVNSELHNKVFNWVDKQTPKTKAKIKAVLEIIEEKGGGEYKATDIEEITGGLLDYNYLYRRAKSARPECEPFVVEHTGPYTFKIDPKPWVKEALQGREVEWSPEKAAASQAVVRGVVKRIEEYGAFCEMPDGNTYLLHWTAMGSKGQGKVEFKDALMKEVYVGKEVDVRVSHIDGKGRAVLNLVHKKKHKLPTESVAVTETSPLTPRMERLVELLQGCCENGDVLLSGKEKTEYHEDLIYLYNNLADFNLRSSVVEEERNRVLAEKARLSKEITDLDSRLKALEEK